MRSMCRPPRNLQKRGKEAGLGSTSTCTAMPSAVEASENVEASVRDPSYGSQTTREFTSSVSPQNSPSSRHSPSTRRTTPSSGHHVDISPMSLKRRREEAEDDEDRPKKKIKVEDIITPITRQDERPTRRSHPISEPISAEGDAAAVDDPTGVQNARPTSVIRMSVPEIEEKVMPERVELTSQVVATDSTRAGGTELVENTTHKLEAMDSITKRALPIQVSEPQTEFCSCNKGD
jgi:hypothetical protein